MRESERTKSSQTAIYLVVAASLLASACTLHAADRPAAHGMIDKVYTDASGEHRYVLFVPEDYSADRKWPVILFLHGAGERGRDGRRQTTIGLRPFVQERARSFPFIVVFPQCEDVQGRSLTGWSPDSPDGRRALAILDEVEREFSVDREREVLTGWSMGGYGTWSLAAATPERWSAVVPLAGGGDPRAAARLHDVPIWAFHGATDRAVPPGESRRMIDAVRAAGGKATLSEVPDVGHGVWQAAYASDELFAWMLNPRGPAPADDKFTAVPGGQRPNGASGIEDGPFVPAVVVPEAVYVRLGNDALQTLADAIPNALPDNVMHGQIANHAEYTFTSGLTFRVDMTRIRYDGRVTRATLQADAEDRLKIQLGLQNTVITIGTTYITGNHHSAVAGPMQIVLGHRRPVWLSVHVRPVVEDNRLRLQLVGSEFDIPWDNWYITSPSGVSTHGFGMTQSKVTSGLVSGLYGSKSRIESDVEALVPTLVAELENHLDATPLTGLVDGLWPIPVMRPRVQLWPEQVATDDAGVSLVFAVAGAAVDPSGTPDTPRVEHLAGFAADDVPKLTSLQVGIAPNVLHALSDLLVKSGQARVHLLDIPEKTFSSLADVNTLATSIPDLARYGDDAELRAELVLASPISVDDAPVEAGADEAAPPSATLPRPDSSATDVNVNVGPARSTFQLEAPRLLIEYAVATDKEVPTWTPVAELELDFAQAAQAKLLKPSYAERILQLDWIGDARITGQGRFAPGYVPDRPELDADAISRLFAQGWESWTQGGPISQVTIPDVDLEFTKLRVSDVGWSSPYLYATFAPAGVRISNDSDQDLEYQVQGPHSGWSSSYTLAPGRSHEFHVAYPIRYRRETNTGTELYTLPAGSHSEFRTPARGGPPQLFKASRNR